MAGPAPSERSPYAPFGESYYPPQRGIKDIRQAIGEVHYFGNGIDLIAYSEEPGYTGFLFQDEYFRVMALKEPGFLVGPNYLNDVARSTGHHAEVILDGIGFNVIERTDNSPRILRAARVYEARARKGHKSGERTKKYNDSPDFLGDLRRDPSPLLVRLRRDLPPDAAPDKLEIPTTNEIDFYLVLPKKTPVQPGQNQILEEAPQIQLPGEFPYRSLIFVYIDAPPEVKEALGIMDTAA